MNAKSVGYFNIFLHRLALPSTSEMFGAFLTSATPTEEVIILFGMELSLKMGAFEFF